MPKIAFLWPEVEFRALGLTAPSGYTMNFGRAGVRAEAEAASINADYIISASGSGTVDAALLGLAPKTRLVQLTGAGYDNVDRHECARLSIPVAYMPGLNAPSVAQTVVQMAFRLRRPLTLLTRGGAEEWTAARANNITGHELNGRVGVIGFGHIGRAVASLFIGLGLEVVRAAHVKQADPFVHALSLKELISTSDIIVVALPATTKTKNLIDTSLLSLIKPGAILLNCGRGGIVDEAALSVLIETGRLAGAGFDVFEQEPLPKSHPFLSLPSECRHRVILTAHVAGQTTESKRRNFSIALDNVGRVARGEPPLYQLDPPASE
ncbi:MAG: (S)-sulfolactate dehydrogenase [Alphaproteobacteria bacterium MarineAlpha9_Bin5]|nr:MAG: (S)-sulfolactate dehydrogenase [Alphaproteobacteria bacterium MarineAlpha9_Bin5]HIB19255.1 hydroxyacid dehydrogenase [Alphaproteobacteria bacterium]HIB56871.1 hydroxyacid dehydrogenase [Alphaproteobacteria bacterium]HIM72410.1 hydroxyacid dehydrogenase [Alphaproteobacteria bacterium]HIN93033.1 hydroxyacid dehydrogenase [Alphaproteobacteria bacterium]